MTTYRDERYITQIACSQSFDAEDESQNYTLFALCNDGTLWTMPYPFPTGNDQEWISMKPIPQPKENDDDAH